LEGLQLELQLGLIFGGEVELGFEFLVLRNEGGVWRVLLGDLNNFN